MIGAGQRGHHVYGAYALTHPDRIRFTAVAEPHDIRRRSFAEAHTIPPERQFRTWEDLLAQGRIGDAAFVCTLDRMHVGPTLAALEAGYDVMLEKPMDTTLAGCVQLVQTAEQAGRLLQICHSLRYTAFFTTLHDIVASGRLGDIITVEHRENVVYWHMAHSFVRGNWRSSQLQSPMILAKCCHDMDILYWNLGQCRRLSSVGSLIHYRAENAPPGAPKRCTDGCPAADDCPWFAPRLYLADRTGWPVSAISEDASLGGRRQALETGAYGRCVYDCDNDVVDHQVIAMECASGASVAMIMHGHSNEETRTMRYDGTRATLRGRFAYGLGDTIEIHDHLTGRVERIAPQAHSGGHGGGDDGLVGAFIRAVWDGSTGITTARESLESHLMAFAAEYARIEGAVVDMDVYRTQAQDVVRLPEGE